MSAKTAKELKELSRIPHLLAFGDDWDAVQLAACISKINSCLGKVEGERLLSLPDGTRVALKVTSSPSGPYETTLAEMSERLRSTVSPFDGLFILLIHHRCEREMYELFAHRAMFVLNEVRLMEHSTNYLFRSPPELDQVLAIGEFVCRRGGSSLVIVDSFDQDLMSPGPDAVLQTRIAELKEVSSDFLGSLSFRRKSGFHSTSRHRSLASRVVDGTQSWRWDPFLECRRLIEQEFGEAKARRVFFQMANVAFGNVADATLNRMHRLCLSAIRLCRLMATRTLEGTPFKFTIFIPPHESITNTYRRVLRFQSSGRSEGIAGTNENDLDKSSLFFNFDYSDEVHNNTELIQSAPLWLQICCNTSRVRWIVTRDQAATLPVVRHLLFADAVLQGGVLIHARNGRVEVYGKSLSAGELTHEQRFALAHDGFRWVGLPSVELWQNLKAHFNDSNNVEVVRGAIAIMFDHCESSLIVLLANEDEARLDHPDGIELQAMRAGRKFEKDFQVSSLTPQALAGLLHIDGAHFIDISGNLCRSAQKVNPQLSVGVARENAVGSGTNAAMDLAKAFPSSRIIKVSASGRIKFFGPMNGPSTHQ